METITIDEVLKLITGDIGNVFIHTNTKEKIYSRAGKEFGNQEGCLIEIEKQHTGYLQVLVNET